MIIVIYFKNNFNESNSSHNTCKENALKLLIQWNRLSGCPYIEGYINFTHKHIIYVSQTHNLLILHLNRQKEKRRIGPKTVA